MNYHLMDSRFNFVQFPQRIRFAIPVDAGIWVGQQDHVIFLRGNDLKGMVMERKASQAPIPHSAMLLSSKDVSAEISQGGLFSALWLANGYVIGTASGQIVELHRQNLNLGRLDWAVQHTNFVARWIAKIGQVQSTK